MNRSNRDVRFTPKSGHRPRKSTAANAADCS
jgi:hypothetical protein